MSSVPKTIDAAELRRFRPYPTYKGSGVEWMGEIPSHWTIKALKRLARLRAGTAITSESIEDVGDYPVFGGNGIRGFTWSYTHEGEYPLIGRQGALCGVVNFAIGKFWASEHAVVAAPEQTVYPSWLAYLLRAMSLNSYSESAAQPGLAVSSISAIRVPEPSAIEQCSIAAFLDRETAKIDALVEKKERLIELLQEKRAAMITRAVTKGLDTTVPMKDSGVEWLGAIPARWEIGELRRLNRRGTSITYGIVQAGPDVEDGVPYIRTSDMAGEELPKSGYQRTSPEIDTAYRRSKVATGDVVVAIRATVGKALMVPDHLDGANLTQGTAKIAPGERLDGGFLLATLQSQPSQQRFEALSKGATFREVTLDMLRRLPNCSSSGKGASDDS